MQNNSENKNKQYGQNNQNSQNNQNRKEQDIKNRVNTVERDGNDLILRHSSRANYITQNGARAPIFHADAVLTMRIHLDQPPSTVEHPNGTAYIPSFSYEDVSLTYSAL